MKRFRLTADTIRYRVDVIKTVKKYFRATPKNVSKNIGGSGTYFYFIVAPVRNFSPDDIGKLKRHLRQKYVLSEWDNGDFLMMVDGVLRLLLGQ